MRLLILLFSIVFLASCNSSADTEKTTIDSTGTNTEISSSGIASAARIDSAQLPTQLKFKGKLYEAWKWNDKLGENILIASLVEPFVERPAASEDEEGMTASLHAIHFIRNDLVGLYRLKWMLNDSEKDCPFDITANFIKDAITITDLDNDGIAETTLQYKLACRSDVSPADMKVIMYEDSVKYSLRGMMWIKAGETDVFTVTEKDMNLEQLPKKKDDYEQIMQTYGRYQHEKEFRNAPPAFLEHARKQWMKHVKESFE